MRRERVDTFLESSRGRVLVGVGRASIGNAEYGADIGFASGNRQCIIAC